MLRYPVNDRLKDFSSVFSHNGFSIYLVGGAVRDFLLKMENHDYDFATDAEPMDMKRMFRHTIDTGIKHGTITILYKGESYEVTSFRTEEGYSDKRHPGKVEFVKSLSEDLKRRDFTINALASSLPKGEIIDEHGGIRDLKKKVLETQADVGIAFDGDGDRVGVVDEKGNMIDIDKYMIIIWRDIYNKVENKKGLFDIKCSKVLEDELIKLGIEPVCYRSGNSYTKAMSVEGNFPFSGEYSGHVFFRDKFPGYDDGIYAGLRLIEILAKP